MAAKRPRRGVLGANDITGVAYFECPAILDFRLVRGRLEVPLVAKWARRGALGAYSSTGNAYFECSAVLYSWPVGGWVSRWALPDGSGGPSGCQVAATRCAWSI